MSMVSVWSITTSTRCWPYVLPSLILVNTIALNPAYSLMDVAMFWWSGFIESWMNLVSSCSMLICGSIGLC